MPSYSPAAPTTGRSRRSSTRSRTSCGRSGPSRSAARASATRAGCSSTTARSWCMCSTARSGSSTPSSVSGATAPSSRCRPRCMVPPPLMAEGERRLVVLRHGRTEWNASQRIQGQLDPALDELGHEQAAAVAPAVARLAPAVLLSSDLRRARQTTEYVAQATGLMASYDERLREYTLGEREGLTHDEYAALDPVEYASFRAGDWDDIPGAETRAEVAERFTAVLK